MLSRGQSVIPPTPPARQSTDDQRMERRVRLRLVVRVAAVGGPPHRVHELGELEQLALRDPIGRQARRIRLTWAAMPKVWLRAVSACAGRRRVVLSELGEERISPCCSRRSQQPPPDQQTIPTRASIIALDSR